MLQLQVNGSAEDTFFYVFTDPLEVTYAVSVADVGNVLRNNWPFVEVCGNVMAGSTNEFNAAREGAMIRAGAFKGWQERMVDVDDSVAVIFTKIVGQDLHVTGQHDEIYVQFLEQIFCFGLLFGLGGFRDRYVVKRNIEPISDVAELFVVGDDGGDFAVVFSGSVAL